MSRYIVQEVTVGPEGESIVLEYRSDRLPDGIFVETLEGVMMFQTLSGQVYATPVATDGNQYMFNFEVDSQPEELAVA